MAPSSSMALPYWGRAGELFYPSNEQQYLCKLGKKYKYLYSVVLQAKQWGYNSVLFYLYYY